MQRAYWCTLLISALASGQAMAETIHFEQSKTGAVPAPWISMITGDGEPRWTIEKDATAPSAPWVLQQSAWTPKPSFPLCVLGSPSLKNGFVEVKFKPVSGTNDQAAGVVWRCQDANNYYVARANALEDNVVLYKVEQGKRKSLDITGRKGGYGVTAKVPGAQWSTLRVTFSGSHFTVSLNGQELFGVEDSSFSGSGKIGLWTKADSVTLFDDFSYGSD